MSILQEILNETESKPIAQVNGRNVYDFEGAVKVSNRELAEEKLQGKKEDFGQRVVRENGLAYTSTKCSAVAINPENYYLNRYKKSKKGSQTVYEVVTDYRAIKEQSSGRVYTNNIVVELVGKAKDGLEYLGKKIISDTEFINEYKSKLNTEAMEQIAKVILGSRVDDKGDSLEA